MTNPILATRSRAGFVERAHHGRLAIVDQAGQVVFSLGDVEEAMLPRSSCKILQALPLVESGAAEAARLDDRRLALACASHQGSAAHASLAEGWLDEMGYSEADLMCGPQVPSDKATRDALRARGAAPSQLHNNCSGKHTGFLCLSRHLGADVRGYVDPGHAVQAAVAEATAEMAGETPAGFAVDGCSAPNFAITLAGLARAMAKFASAETVLTGVRRRAAIRLRDAMAAYPFEVAGEGRCCTDLMRAGGGRFAVKTGAEGAFVAILPELRLGVALKIDDGNTAAAECAMAGVLVALGAVGATDPRIARWLIPEEVNRRGIVCGGGEPSEAVRNLTIA